MAVRLMMYCALLWQRTIHEDGLGARDKLPPVLGIRCGLGNRKCATILSMSAERWLGAR